MQNYAGINGCCNVVLTPQVHVKHDRTYIFLLNMELFSTHLAMISL